MKQFSIDTITSIKTLADSVERLEIATAEAERKYNGARMFFMAKPSQVNMFNLQRALEYYNTEREQLEKTRRYFEQEVLNASPTGSDK